MRPYSLALLAVIVVAAAAALLLHAPAALAQLAPWPTPPPGPTGPYPQVVPSDQITPVPAPAAPGSIALQVDPIFAGPVPRIPPRPSVIVSSGEADPQAEVTLEFEAGALTQTVQLTYQPLPVGLAPSPLSGQTLVRAFQVSLYNPKGAPTTPTFQIPVKLTLQPQAEDRTAAGNDPARLWIARYDDQGKQWVPQETRYDAQDGALQARILQPGLFGVIAFPAPVK